MTSSYKRSLSGSQSWTVAVFSIACRGATSDALGSAQIHLPTSQGDSLCGWSTAGIVPAGIWDLPGPWAWTRELKKTPRSSNTNTEWLHCV